MAKKLSTLVIDATVNTSGIDKAVSSINNKLKNVKGSGGGSGRDGRFSAGVNPLQYVGGSGASSVAAAAFGAALGSRGGAASMLAKSAGKGAFYNPEIASWSSGAREQLRRLAPFGDYMVNRMERISARIREHHKTAKEFEKAARSAAPSARGDLLSAAIEERDAAKSLNRQRDRIGRFSSRLGAYSYEARSLRRQFASGGLTGLIGTAGVAGAVRYMTNFRQNVYGQFNDLDQFVGSPMFDAAKGLRNTGFANRSGQRTLTQSLMLGARSANPNQPSMLETGGGGIQDYYNSLFYGVGAMFSGDPLGQMYQSIIPGSPYRQALGEDPNNLGWFARLQASIVGTWQGSRRGSV